MNTGVQRSGATPGGARTATTQPVGPHPGNEFGQGKNLPRIAMAHEIPYVGTATVADLRDLEYKVEKAMTFRGARYLHILVTCPLGWGSASRDSIRIARLAVETGIFPVFEAERGEVTGVTKIRRRVPVEEYLKLQRRYAHLFGKKPQPEILHNIQAAADRNITRYGLLDDTPDDLKPPGEAKDAATSGRARPTTPDRGGLSGRSTSTACHRVTTPVRPGRTSSPGCTRPRRAAKATRRAGGRSWPTTRSQQSWAGCATTPARPPATGLSWTPRWASTPSSGSSATRPSSRGGASRSPRR